MASAAELLEDMLEDGFFERNSQYVEASKCFFQTVSTQIAKAVPEKAAVLPEHYLSSSLAYVARWSSLDSPEAALPAIILAEHAVARIESGVLLGVFPRIEQIAAELLSSHAVPLIVTLQFLHLVSALVDGVLVDSVFPEVVPTAGSRAFVSTLPRLLAALCVDSRRPVFALAQGIVLSLVSVEVAQVTDRPMAICSIITEVWLSALDSGKPPAATRAAVNALTAACSSQKTTDRDKDQDSNDSAPLENVDVSLLPLLLIGASGGTCNTLSTPGGMLIVRIMQLLECPSLLGPVLSLLSRLILHSWCLSRPMLCGITEALLHAPDNEHTIDKLGRVLGDAYAVLLRDLVRTATDRTLSAAIEQEFGEADALAVRAPPNPFSLVVDALKYFNGFYTRGGQPSVASSALALVLSIAFSYDPLLHWGGTEEFALAIKTLCVFVNVSSDDSLFRKAHKTLVGVAAACYAMSGGARPDYAAVNRLLWPLFEKLTLLAASADNAICSELIEEFISRMPLEVAVATFDCGLPGLTRRPLTAKPHSWLLPLYARSNGGSIAAFYTEVFTSALVELVSSELVDPVAKSVLITQVWNLLPCVFAHPDYEDFRSDAGNVETVKVVGKFFGVVFTHLFTELEEPFTGICLAAMTRLVVHAFLAIADAPGGDTLKTDFLQYVQGTVAVTCLPSLFDLLLQHSASEGGRAVAANFPAYLNLVSLLVAVAPERTIPVATTNIVKTIAASLAAGPDAALGRLPGLLDLLSAVLLGASQKKFFTPLGPDTFQILFGLVDRLLAAPALPLKKHCFKLMGFLLESCTAQPEKADDVISKIAVILKKECGGVEDRGLLKHRIALLHEVSGFTPSGDILPMLELFGSEILACTHEGNAKARRASSLLLHAAAHKVLDGAFAEKASDTSGADSGPEASIAQLGKLFAEGSELFAHAPLEFSGAVLTDRAVSQATASLHAESVLLLAETEAVRRHLLAGMPALIRAGIDVQELNRAHPFYTQMARSVLHALRAACFFVHEDADTHDVDLYTKGPGAGGKVGLASQQSRETMAAHCAKTGRTFRVECGVSAALQRAVLLYLSIYVAACGPTDLYSDGLLSTILETVLLFMAGPRTSPCWTLCKRILLGSGVCVGYDYLKASLDEAQTTVSELLVRHHVALLHPESLRLYGLEEVPGIVGLLGVPLARVLEDARVSSNEVVLLRNNAAMNTAQGRKLCTAVLSGLRGKQANSLIGRFGGGVYSDLGLPVPEEFAGFHARGDGGSVAADLRALTHVAANEPGVRSPAADAAEDGGVTHVGGYIVVADELVGGAGGKGARAVQDLAVRSKGSALLKSVADVAAYGNRRFAKGLNSTISALLQCADTQDLQGPVGDRHAGVLHEYTKKDKLLADSLQTLKRMRERRLQRGKVHYRNIGTEFQSSRAGGDVARKGVKTDPYAYMPLVSGRLSKVDRLRRESGMGIAMATMKRDDKVRRSMSLNRAQKRAMKKGGPHAAERAPGKAPGKAEKARTGSRE